MALAQRRSALRGVIGIAVAVLTAASGFVLPSTRLWKVRTSVVPRANSLKKSTPQEPWKPLVFKMPMKKPERVLPPDDDGFTKRMREKLKGLKLQDEKAASEPRAVSETKIQDLVNKEADDAKINGLYAMWFMDKEADRRRLQEENPGLEDLRKKFEQQKHKLDGVPERVVSQSVDVPAAGHRKGLLNLASELVDPEEMMEQARAWQESPQSLQAAVQQEAPPRPASAEAQAATDEAVEEDEGVAEFLLDVQRRSARADGVSKRVVKSPEDRKRDYEETKLRMYAITGALGLAGSGVSAVQFGIDVAFGFGLGSIAALSYLTGLSAYTDNAESPMGQMMGGRRLLTPVILVLVVQGWDRIEAQVPMIAELHLQPALLPALLGFFLYSVGKVLGGGGKF